VDNLPPLKLLIQEYKVFSSNQRRSFGFEADKDCSAQWTDTFHHQTTALGRLS